MAIKSTLFDDYNTAQEALNKARKKTIKALNQVIADLNLQPHELTFPSAAEPTAPKGDEPKKARKPAEWMYPNPDNPEESYIPGMGKPPKWWANFKAGKSDGEVAAWKDANKQKNPAYTAVQGN